jgi:hypothetical protein
MTGPSLFYFATSELSQDAFICWLLSWADPSAGGSDQPLHRTATALLDRLMASAAGNDLQRHGPPHEPMLGPVHHAHAADAEAALDAVARVVQ